MGSVCSRFCGGESANVAEDSAPSSPASVPPPRDDECMNKDSVFYDARQSMTESMGIYVPVSLPNYVPRGSVLMEKPETLLLESDFSKKRRQTVLVKYDLQEPQLRVEGRGYPGNLTEEELEACLAFRQALKEDTAKRDMVECFIPKGIEEEPYALCRFLRGKNFNIQDTLIMVDANMPLWTKFKQHDFYPTIEEAVGCPGSVLLSQYPYLFWGNARNGCPVNYQMVGRIKMEGVACVTDLDRVANYVMHSIMYQFTKQVKVAQEQDSSRLVRCECVAVIDLKGLEASQLNKTTLGVLQNIGKATGCFPEMLNRMIVLNAGYTFSFFWTLIKAFLEARTVAKIEIYTNEQKGIQRLHELIDKNELLSDYNGTGPSFDELAQECGSKSGATRQAAKLMTMNGTPQPVVTLSKDEKASVSVYTKSEGKVTLLRDANVIKTVEVKRPNGDSSSPFSTEITSREAREGGPGNLNVTAMAGASSNSSDYLLVFVEVFHQAT